MIMITIYQSDEHLQRALLKVMVLNQTLLRLHPHCGTPFHNLEGDHLIRSVPKALLQDEYIYITQSEY